jgi:hypothetical protein
MAFGVYVFNGHAWQQAKQSAFVVNAERERFRI